LSLAAPAAHGQDAVRTVFRVFVKAAEVQQMPMLDDWDALKSRRDQARQTRRVLENELREVYGSGRGLAGGEGGRALSPEQAEALADAD
jgi:hypothetical protein